MYFIIINAYQSPLVSVYFNEERTDALFWTTIRDYIIKMMPGYNVEYHPNVPKITLKLNYPASMLFLSVLRNLLQNRYNLEWQYLRPIPSLLQITLDSIKDPEKFATALCHYQEKHGLQEALRAVYIYYRDLMT